MDSPAKTFDSKGYPGPQRLLFNRDVVWHEGFVEQEKKDVAVRESGYGLMGEMFNSFVSNSLWRNKSDT